MSRRVVVFIAVVAVMLVASAALADCSVCSTTMIPGQKMCKSQPTGTMSSCWADCQGTYETCLEYSGGGGADGGSGTYYGGKCTSSDGYCPPSCSSCSSGMKY